jgi:hypothetical protein
MSSDELSKRLNGGLHKYIRPIIDAVRRQEQECFARILPNLRKTHPGKYALIMGDDLLGVYENHTAAYKEGMKRFKSDIFLVAAIA